MAQQPFTVVYVDPRADMKVEMTRGEVEKAGAQLVTGNCRGEDEVISAVSQADAIITRSAFISRRVLENAPRCRIVVRTGVGVDAVDIEAATDLGVAVANVPDFCLEEVSNHAIMLMLALAKKLAPLHAGLKAGRWRSVPLAPMGSICGQTLGLLALGNIARATARKAKALGMEVVAYDPYVPPSLASKLGVTLLSLDELLPISDYVSNHLPLTAETRRLVGEGELRLMKSSAFFINTGRGGTVDQAALSWALQEGWIAGAGLDVFENEPVEADSPLCALDNVVLTPHTASFSDRAFEELAVKVGREAVSMMKGGWPASMVNPEVKDRTRR